MSRTTSHNARATCLDGHAKAYFTTTIIIFKWKLDALFECRKARSVDTMAYVFLEPKCTLSTATWAGRCYVRPRRPKKKLNLM